MFDIIIVTYNAKDKLRRCIRSIKRYTKDYLITVVDNNSRDGTRQYLKFLKGINTIFNKRNLGFCGGANIALRNTNNEFIVLLDDDAEVTKGWIHGLYAQIKNRPKVGIVGCRIVFPNNRIHSAEYRVSSLYHKQIGLGEIDRGQRNYIKKCDALIGTCWLMRRKVIEKVGYFDERFFPSQHEDIDYCIRTRLAGYKIIYNGQVNIIHHHLGRDGGKRQKRKNMQKFLRKWKYALPKFPLKDSHPVDIYIANGVSFLKKNKFKQALCEFKKAELIDKRFSEPLYIGVALEGMGKYNEAIKQFKKYLNLNPSNLVAQVHIWTALKEMGEHKKATQELKKAFSPYLSNIRDYNNLGLIYKNMGLSEEAKRQLLKVFKLKVYKW